MGSETLFKVRYVTRQERHVEGDNKVSPKERKRRLAKHLVDRNHRGVVLRYRRPPSWTLGEKAALVLSLAFIFAAVVLTLALVMLLP